MPKRSKEPWISTYDESLGRMISWDEMQKEWYRAHCLTSGLVGQNGQIE
jgi:hypothetical protein